MLYHIITRGICKLHADVLCKVFKILTSSTAGRGETVKEAKKTYTPNFSACVKVHEHVVLIDLDCWARNIGKNTALSQL